MATQDLHSIIEKSKEFLGLKNMTDEKFLSECRSIERFWNSNSLLIENVGASFITNVLYNGSNISDEDKVKIVDAVLNDWTEEMEKNIKSRKQNNG
jgi:hypothetical protein